MRTLLLLLTLMSIASPALADTRAARAAALYARALEHIQRNTFDTRRLAIDELERATLLQPGNPTYELALARLYQQVGFLGRARNRYERVAELQPDSALAQYELGRVWRRDWLKYQDPRSYRLALSHLQAATTLDSARADAWLHMVPMFAEHGDWRSASIAAQRASASRPDDPQVRIADAYTAYQMGRIEYADSLFDVEIPLLPMRVRERFEDIAPVASERDTMILHRLSPRDQAEFIERFWREYDPDLVSPVNEARLAYRARVAHAFLLYFDTRRGEWDQRGEVYCRYGAPAQIRYNPVGSRFMITLGTGPDYPLNLLVWDYPQLGMQVQMEDRFLNDFYYLPVLMERDPEPQPPLDLLDRQPELLTTRGGRGVFPMLPPHTEPRQIDGMIARFDAARGGRLLAQMQSPGAPDDSLFGEWVVLDTLRNEVTRGRRALAPSACEPTEFQVAEFAHELEPGSYIVGLAVGDREGRRGVSRTRVTVEPRPDELAMSDLVVTCGLPPPIGMGAAPAVRLEPNPSALVLNDDPLTAYFEIYHLTPGPDRRVRFEYVYTVRSAEKDPRSWLQRVISPRPRPAPLEISREDEASETLRRQFVVVPVASLPSGRYTLEVVVRDLVANVEFRRQSVFTRLAEGVPGAH